jgi:hypothetical protein
VLPRRVADPPIAVICVSTGATLLPFVRCASRPRELE